DGRITRTGLDFTNPDSFRRVPAGRERSAPGFAPGDLAKLISAVSLSPDGKWLITCGNHQLRVWDAASGARRGELYDVQNEKRSVREVRLAVTPDGRTVKAVDSESIRLFSLPELKLLSAVPRLLTGGGP